MFVKSIMIPKGDSLVINYSDTIKNALHILETNQIDGLPVLENEKYVGTITRYRVYECFFQSSLDKEDYLRNTTVGEIATNQETYLQGDEIFEHTLLMLKDFPLLAVVDENMKFLGTVTRYDVLEQFQSAFGMNKNGVRIAFTSIEIEGRIAKLAEIAKTYHEHIISLVTFDETDKLVRRIVMKVEKKENTGKFIKKLEDSGFRILSIIEV